MDKHVVVAVVVLCGALHCILWAFTMTVGLFPYNLLFIHSETLTPALTTHTHTHSSLPWEAVSMDTRVLLD